MGRNNKAKNIGVTELAIQHGLEPMRVICRLHCGWTLERALNTPVRQVKNAFVLENGQTLHNYCKENGLGKKEYARCCNLVKEKCLTPDEALKYHRTPKNPNHKLIKKQRQRVMVYGYTKEQSVLPDIYFRHQGLLKQSKYHFKGTTLHNFCKSERKKLPYSTIRKICKAYKIGVYEAVKNYRKGMTYSSYRNSKYERRISYA